MSVSNVLSKVEKVIKHQEFLSRLRCEMYVHATALQMCCIRNHDKFHNPYTDVDELRVLVYSPLAVK